MSRNLPNLNSLKAFEAAGRHENFSRAGEELAVSHVAISRHVKVLEEWLGVKLFKRTGRGVVLTDLGVQYISDLSPVLDNLSSATKAILDIKHDNVLYITCDPALAFQWLIPKLKRFSDFQPDVTVSVDPTEEIIDIATSDFDLGIRYGYGQWDGLKAVEIYRPNLIPVCSPEYLQTAKFNGLKDMATVGLLHDDSSAPWKEWFCATGVKRKRKSSDATFEKFLALSAAESGLGVALGDELLCIESLKKGTLVSPLDNLIPSKKSYYLVSPAVSHDCKAIIAFGQWLSLEAQKSIKEFDDLVSAPSQ